jgi:hypothetical protein
VTVSSPPPSFFFVSLFFSSCHWYIATLRVSLMAFARTPNSGSASVSVVVASPLR